MMYHAVKLHNTFVGWAYLHSNILSIRLIYRHSYQLTYFIFFVHLKLTIAPPNISTNEFTISHKWNSIYDERENDANNIRKTWYGESAISQRLSSEYSFSPARAFDRYLPKWYEANNTTTISRIWCVWIYEN